MTTVTILVNERHSHGQAGIQWTTLQPVRLWPEAAPYGRPWIFRTGEAKPGNVWTEAATPDSEPR